MKKETGFEAKYNPNDLTESDRFWKEWLWDKKHLHPDTVGEIRNQWIEGGCSLVLDGAYSLEPTPEGLTDLRAHRELKDKATRIKEQINLVNSVLTEYQQKVFATAEILRDLRSNLNIAQRELLAVFKGLSDDEVLAIRAGLTVEEIRLGKKLIKETSEEIKVNGQKD